LKDMEVNDLGRRRSRIFLQAGLDSQMTDLPDWTRPLQSARVPAEGNESLWLEDLIAQEHGPGEQPRDERR
jgi:hypothetical protein